MGPDDAYVLAALRGRAAYEVRPWDDPAVRWSDYDAVVVRSTWDYYQHADAFRAWIDARSADGSNTWNPPDVLSWNMDKRYLRELAERGVEIVETEWIDDGRADVAAILRRRGWDRAVAKPVVSAGAWRTVVVTRERPSIDPAGQTGSGGTMLQPFLDEIVTEGEWSLVFFGGRYSHAVVKRPAAGDYRVQLQHGGSVHPAEPPRSLVHAAERVVAAAGRDLLYARVDGVRSGGRLVVIELEALEPVLYLGTAAGSGDRFVADLLRRLR
jgi:glutathione synthase/RimK-type ligase-like ATP-grasp enzyme